MSVRRTHAKGESMPVLNIGTPPTPMMVTRRRLIQMGAAMTAVVACAPQTPEQLAAAENAGIAPWPTDVIVPTVDHPGYGYYPDYFEIGDTGPWPKILSDDHKQKLERFSDLILPATDTAPAPSAVGIADFFDDWTSAPYPWMSDTRKTVHEGFVWLDAQSRLMFGCDWMETTDDQAREILDMMQAASRDTGPLIQAGWMYKNLRELIIGAYYTTPEGEAELGYIHAEPISGDYPGPTGEALDHIKGVILAAGLDFDDLPVGPPATGGTP